MAATARSANAAATAATHAVRPARFLSRVSEERGAALVCAECGCVVAVDVFSRIKSRGTPLVQWRGTNG
jgi:hypothetical protein